ncbi:hypothetical protein V8B55DRAFT_1472558 [Mucor lusitanicus]
MCFCKTRAITSGVPENVRPNPFYYPCDSKDYDYFSHKKSNLKVHRRAHLPKAREKKYKCDAKACDYSTDRPDAFKIHKKTHLPKD